MTMTKMLKSRRKVASMMITDSDYDNYDGNDDDDDDDDNDAGAQTQM